MEDERGKNLRKIDEINHAIWSNNLTKEATLSRYLARKALVEEHEKQIRLIQEQKEWFKQQLESTEKIIESLQADEETFRKEYQYIIKEQSKLSNQELSFINIMAFETVNEIVQRRAQLSQYERRRREQIASINAVIKKLSESRSKFVQLEQEYRKREELLKSELEHHKIMRKKLESEYQELQKNEKTLNARRQEIERINQFITEEVGKLIAANHQKINSNPAAEESNLLAENRSLGENSKNTIIAPPSGTIRSHLFAEHKSLLPWPVNRFIFIASRFGMQHYPGSQVPVENLGIEICTPHNEQVYSIFEGRVLALYQDPFLGGWIVILQHDDYFSVYAPLQNIKVKVGNFVKVHTLLGTVKVNQDGYSILKFQIWRQKQKLDPEEWLAKY
ncbi:MAG: peptidoglycan DD-metalloendopeptidase family protein [Cytophagales bacterium]|nr:peptidoglycan DD-metalloendopeptidase family protein [Bernardetiaceae bacterium]MDW8209671.1 peptidoglycan DD-metalloendopeptidase family protein [Cytophagales bacterium]